MDRESPKSLPTDPREAVQWLLLAYSIGHAPDCHCEACSSAHRQLDAAADDAAA